MTQRKFDEVVGRLSAWSKDQSGAYQAAVLGLALLGYLYIGLVLLLLLGVCGLVIGGIVLLVYYARFAGVALLKLGIPLIAGVGALTASVGSAFTHLFRIKFDPPEGIPMPREQNPRLFAMLDDLSAKLKAPRFHHVLLTDDFNAGVKQVPRLGVFGWQTNYLVIGLPLMQALSPEQFRAVIAHEIGHLSHSHSRFAGWIYRLRGTWDHLLERLSHEQSPGMILFVPFFRWYAPLFAAYSFVHARANEYVADRCSAEASGRQAAAEALVLTQIKGRYLQEEYWPKVFESAKAQAAPPAMAFVGMVEALPQAGAGQHTDRWLEEALWEKTDTTDTHPSLTDRLAALGYHASHGGPLDLPKPPLEVPPPPDVTAAQRYLGEAARHYAGRFEAEWQRGAARFWQQRHQEAQKEYQRLVTLELQETLTPEEEMERAQLTAEYRGPDEAIPLLRAATERHPDSAPVHFHLGRLLLDQENPEGVTHLEKAVSLERRAGADACAAASWFLRRQGRLQEAARYRERSLEYRRERERAQEERSEVRPEDRFQYHSLPLEEIQKIRAGLMRRPEIRAAYLVRKAVTAYPDSPLYVLGVVIHRQERDSTHAILSFVTQYLTMPGETFLFCMDTRKPLARAVRNVANSLIYQKG